MDEIHSYLAEALAKWERPLKLIVVIIK
jgi:hypothetical protein